MGRRSLVWVLAFCVVLAPSLLTPTRAYACSCAYESSDRRLVERAEVIFAGELVADRRPAFGRSRELTFAVSRVYKGQALAEQVVVTADNSASCGLEVSGAGPYVIFARGPGGDHQGLSPGKLQSGLCDGNRPGPAPASLGAGTTPTPSSAAPPRTGSGLGRGGIGGLVVLTAAVVLYVLRRRRRLEQQSEEEA